LCKRTQTHKVRWTEGARVVSLARMNNEKNIPCFQEERAMAMSNKTVEDVLDKSMDSALDSVEILQAFNGSAGNGR
jgi:hypothetical protein